MQAQAIIVPIALATGETTKKMLNGATIQKLMEIANIVK